MMMYSQEQMSLKLYHKLYLSLECSILSEVGHARVMDVVG